MAAEFDETEPFGALGHGVYDDFGVIAVREVFLERLQQHLVVHLCIKVSHVDLRLAPCACGATTVRSVTSVATAHLAWNSGTWTPLMVPHPAVEHAAWTAAHFRSVNSVTGLGPHAALTVHVAAARSTSVACTVATRSVGGPVQLVVPCRSLYLRPIQHHVHILSDLMVRKFNKTVAFRQQFRKSFLSKRETANDLPTGFPYSLSLISLTCWTTAYCSNNTTGDERKGARELTLLKSPMMYCSSIQGSMSPIQSVLAPIARACSLDSPWLVIFQSSIKV